MLDGCDRSGYACRMGDGPINLGTGRPLSEHEMRERKVVETFEKNAASNEKMAETGVQQVDAMNAMTQQIAAMAAMERVRMANNLLGDWTQGRPGRIDRATIRDALATVDDLLSLSKAPPES